MWWDKRKVGTYHNAVPVIAGIMMLSTVYGIVLVLPRQGPAIDPVVKWAFLAILVLMLFLSVLMFQSPSRIPNTMHWPG